MSTTLKTYQESPDPFETQRNLEMKQRNDEPSTLSLGRLGGTLYQRAHVIRLQRSRRHFLRPRGAFKEAPSSLHEEDEEKHARKGHPSLAGATSNPNWANMTDEAGPSGPTTPENRPADERSSEEKEKKRVEGTRPRSYRHGLISVMGRRRAMHEAVAAVPGGGPWGCDFFAVYDGQGGAGTAGRCRERMHEVVAEEAEEEGGEGSEYWEKVMRRSFGKMQEEVVAGNSNGEGGGEVGSTALVVVLGEREIVVANCGDSRVVLCRAGVPVPLSRDYTGEIPDGQERMENSGRQVSNWAHVRFVGLVASSGSNEYGPKVTVTDQTEQDEFLVIATNGLWDAISDEDTCRVVHNIIPEGRFRDSRDGIYASQAAAVLAKLAVARGSKDNISVIVVELKQ